MPIELPELTPIVKARRRIYELERTLVTYRKATQLERDLYRKGQPVYPLGGFVKVAGQSCAVESLGAFWSKDDPQYEIMAPRGQHFTGDGEGCHSLLCTDLKDVAERAKFSGLTPCHCDD